MINMWAAISAQHRITDRRQCDSLIASVRDIYAALQSEFVSVNNVFFNAGPHSTTWPWEYVRGTVYWDHHFSSVSAPFSHSAFNTEHFLSSQHISRNSFFGLSNVQAFIYFQTHRSTGITFYKLVVRPCRLLLSSLLHATSGHLVVVGILSSCNCWARHTLNC